MSSTWSTPPPNIGRGPLPGLEQGSLALEADLADVVGGGGLDAAALGPLPGLATRLRHECRPLASSHRGRAVAAAAAASASRPRIGARPPGSWLAGPRGGPLGQQHG